MEIDTRRVKNRIQVHFDNLDQMLAYVEQLVFKGTRQLGNWSLGQNIQHLALTQIASIEGFSKLYPLLIRIPITLMFKKRMLIKGFTPSGPKVKTLTMPPEIDANTALKNLKLATHRVKSEQMRALNPLFGNMTLNEWNLLYLRHAELHLGYSIQLVQ